MNEHSDLEALAAELAAADRKVEVAEAALAVAKQRAVEQFADDGALSAAELVQRRRDAQDDVDIATVEASRATAARDSLRSSIYVGLRQECKRVAAKLRPLEEQRRNEIVQAICDLLGERAAGAHRGRIEAMAYQAPGVADRRQFAGLLDRPDTIADCFALLREARPLLKH